MTSQDAIMLLHDVRVEGRCPTDRELGQLVDTIIELERARDAGPIMAWVSAELRPESAGGGHSIAAVVNIDAKELRIRASTREGLMDLIRSSGQGLASAIIDEMAGALG